MNKISKKNFCEILHNADSINYLGTYPWELQQETIESLILFDNRQSKRVTGFSQKIMVFDDDTKILLKEKDKTIDFYNLWFLPAFDRTDVQHLCIVKKSRTDINREIISTWCYFLINE